MKQYISFAYLNNVVTLSQPDDQFARDAAAVGSKLHGLCTPIQVRKGPVSRDIWRYPALMISSIFIR